MKKTTISRFLTFYRGLFVVGSQGLEPWTIRFVGEKAEVGARVAHSHGPFQQFVFIRTDAIRFVMECVVPGFADSESDNPNSLYKKVAVSFNGLSDADFVLSEDGDSMTFPTGYSDRDGRPVLLFCVPNSKAQPAWYSDSVLVDGRRYGSLFGLANANWYDVEQAVCDIACDCRESAEQIVQKIERRCVDWQNALVWLKEGQPCEPAQADELCAPTGFCEKGGQEIYLLFSRRSGSHGYGWYFHTASYAGAPLTIFEKKTWMEKWAGSLEKWRTPTGNNALPLLAAQTLEERWSFGKRSDFGILKNYLRYTFSHQWETGKIGYSADGRYAAFNTGLPDRGSYKHLYALFVQNPDESRQTHPLHFDQKYVFQEFVVSGRGGNGKILSGNIRPLPTPPQYFAVRSDTVWELEFNDSNQVTLPEYDDRHILFQRCERIPLAFYGKVEDQAPGLRDILNSGEPTEEKYKRIREYFRPVVEPAADAVPRAEVVWAHQELSTRLESVISNAVKRLSWNWRAVVPCYNPERGESCFLLPVSFCDPSGPDRAMIASMARVEEELVYTIHTVIPLDWAYLDARLVCRPESEWLAADCIDEDED